LGKMFGNVPTGDKPSRFMLRQDAIDLLANIKNLKTFAEGGNQQEDKKITPKA